MWMPSHLKNSVVGQLKNFYMKILYLPNPRLFSGNAHKGWQRKSLLHHNVIHFSKNWRMLLTSNSQVPRLLIHALTLVHRDSSFLVAGVTACDRHLFDSSTEKVFQTPAHEQEVVLWLCQKPVRRCSAEHSVFPIFCPVLDSVKRFIFWEGHHGTDARFVWTPNRASTVR